MTTVLVWSILMCSGLLGAMIATHLALPIRAVELLLAYTGEILVAAIGIALLNTDYGTTGAEIVGAGLIAGTVLAFILIPRTVPVGDYATATRSRLSLWSRQVGLNAPEFVALGILAMAGAAVDVAFLAAVYMSNFAQSIPTTISLRRLGLSASEIYLHWLAVSVCLVAIAVVSFIVFEGASSTIQVAVLALAAGGMHVALVYAQQNSSDRPSLVGLLRFGIAFLIASLLSV